jgi:hypothetical protein
VKASPEREGRNPSTGATVKIPASKKLTFAPAKALKEALNKRSAEIQASPFERVLNLSVPVLPGIGLVRSTSYTPILIGIV